mgnify:CR=1 FL=1
MTEARPITIAVAALGGQGGGVLSTWIVETAEAAGYIAQYTSVPGVAQRTGATVYCIEIFPKAAAEAAGAEPVLALMPMPGDVEVVIAAELMEAGRAINRGFVTPDATTLIASTHREYAIAEKSAPGDGIADADTVLAAARDQAHRLIAFDMQALAEASGSVVSAALFGALAGSGALEIARERFEETIRKSGRMVEANLKAFAAAYERAQRQDAETAATRAPARDAPAASLPRARSVRSQAVIDRIARDYPAETQDVLLEGARRCVDYQDPAYAALYLDRLAPLTGFEHGNEGHRHALTRETARHLALWMTYEDTIRVADLKTRRSRFERTEREVRAGDDQIVTVTEFMHPRIEELADTLPAPLGRWVLRSPFARAGLKPLTSKGRRIATGKLSGFFLLYTLARLRAIRRHTLRYKTETDRIEAWLAEIARLAPERYELAVELARCQRLIKGYGDTHARGLEKYGRILEVLPALERGPDGAARLARLRAAALEDEEGAALAQALAEYAGEVRSGRHTDSSYSQL